MSDVYLPKACIRRYYHEVSVFGKLKDHSFNAQNIRYGEMANRLFEIYKHSVVPHCKHMFQTEYEMAMVTMCAYPSFNYALPHCKCVFHCCAYFSCIDIPSPESDQYY